MPVPADVTSHYADYYSGVSEWRDLGAAMKAANVIALAKGQRSLLDVGCGDGAVLARLSDAKLAETFVGVEVSPSALRAAESRHYSAPVTFGLFDGVSLPYEDKSFDLGVLSHVVEHVEDPRGLLTETVRVCRALVVEVPLELNLRTPRFAWTDVGHINVYNRRSIRHLIESCGVRVERELVYCPPREIHTFQGRRGASLKWLVKAAARPFGGAAVFTYNYAALAR